MSEVTEMEEQTLDLTQFHSCDDDLYWRGCYNTFSNWRRYVTAESFAHPAKMAPRLCDRIFKHLKKLELLHDDSVICDFMAGVGTTNIQAALHGYDSISVELETHFIEMIEGNRERLHRVIGKNKGWEVIQGDARKLSTLLQKKGCAGVISPPYRDIQVIDYQKEHAGPIGINARIEENRKVVDIPIEAKTGYSTNPSNIGNLPDKALVGVISPPYTQGREGGGLNKNPPETFRGVLKGHSLIEGESEGQIGNLPDKELVGVVSPVYPETIAHVGGEGATTLKRVGISTKTSRRYSNNPDNIGNLQDGKLVGITSPPYSDIAAEFRNTGSKLGGESFRYNSGAEKNIGNLADVSDYEDNTKAAWWRDKAAKMQTETYLEAMLEVYHEAHLSGISPLVTVTKNPTRGGKLRRLDIDTAKLLMAAGYEIIDYHRAVLFEERKQRTFAGDVEKVPKGRLSFFKRLSYQKGNVVARWEDVIFAVA